MRCRPYIITLTILALAAVAGCVDSTKVGLSNAPAREWRQARTDRNHDVISNGDDSCERPGSSSHDPAPLRLNACPGIERKTPRVAAIR